MSPSVIAHRMASAKDLFNQRRMSCGVLANHEECRRELPVIEFGEDIRGVYRVRAVIEGERNHGQSVLLRRTTAHEPPFRWHAGGQGMLHELSQNAHSFLKGVGASTLRWW